ncbi:MarR family winged helix-turn-helix transcriptional regulator [Streptomyces sp. KR55]|uniref:MarR family winged helix-turn-helix transcriptional regulator n=1 Tax=Streptomyces sp. KR55 TaxID=3457425 RepID=UPI003FD473EC
MTTAHDRQRQAALLRKPSAGPARIDPHTIAVQLRRMSAEINRLVHRFAGDDGLHSTDVQALTAILDADEPMTPGRLRRHLGLTSGAVSACVERLERAGHIRRVRHSSDRRVARLHCAADARSYLRPLAEATPAARTRFSEPELAVALRFLAAMNEELSLKKSSGG